MPRPSPPSSTRWGSPSTCSSIASRLHALELLAAGFTRVESNDRYSGSLCDSCKKLIQAARSFTASLNQGVQCATFFFAGHGALAASCPESRKA
eukprot:789927-Prymnesium_polylepis.1